MDQLYYASQRQQEALQKQLGLYQATPLDQSDQYHREAQDIITQLYSNCDRLQHFVNKEPISKRQVAKIKVDQLRYDTNHMAAALQKIHDKKLEEQRYAAQHDHLLNQRFRPNNELTIEMDQGIEHNTALYRSNQAMDGLIEGSNSVLESLYSQNTTLKTAHRKILDVANTLGLSNTVMRLIEGRTAQDRAILFAGMIFSTILMFLIWKYFG